MTHPRESVTGVVLAGGMGRRMGGCDKGLVELSGRPLIRRVIDRLEPQTGAIIINANRNEAVYRALGYPVVGDLVEGYHGPLAGMASGMQAARTPYVVTAPCDAPFLPGDLVERLYRALVDAGAQIAVAHADGRMQPVFALLERTLADSITDFLSAGERKIDRWYARRHAVTVDFSDVPGAFANVNTLEEIESAEAVLRQGGHD